MAIYIQVISGPDEGKKFRAKHGLKLGRKKADFIVQDTSASGHHATIHKKGPDEFYLVDNTSKNGTKVNGIREDVFELAPGLEFAIGKTLFRVMKELQNDVEKLLEQPTVREETFPPITNSNFDFSTQQSLSGFSNNPEKQELPPLPEESHIEISIEDKFSSPSLSVDPPIEEPAEDSSNKPIDEPDERIIEVEVNKEWHDTLEDFAQKTFAKIKSDVRSVQPMNPALRLKFIRGLQADTVWTLAYGPRTIGADQYDLVILEPGAPGKCFELLPKAEGGVEFRTKHADKVLVNKSKVNKCVLANGDSISIADTEIKVEMVE